MEFFASPTPQEYVARATAFAAKLKSLAKRHASMRAGMAASPLCNRGKFGVSKSVSRQW